MPDDLYSRRHSFCGTKEYMSPEVINGEKFGGHSFPADTWALGIMVYNMLIGEFPLGGPTEYGNKPFFSGYDVDNLDFPNFLNIS